MDKLKNLTIGVVGVSFKNNDGTNRSDIISQININDPVFLVIDENNPYDSNAISVMHILGQIGYIPKDIASVLHNIISTGGKFVSIVANKGVYNGVPNVKIRLDML